MAPSRYCDSTLITSSRALPTSAAFSFGMIRSSMPIDRPDLRRVGEAEVLQRVEHLDRLLEPELQVAALHELLQPLLLQQAVDERHLRRNRLVEDDAADGGVDDLVLDRLHFGAQHVLIVARGGQVLQIAGVAQPDRRQRLELARPRAPASRRPGCRTRGPRPWRRSSPWSGSSSRARCPATESRSARRAPATGCCCSRASAPTLRSAPRATAGCGPPSGRRRSRR